MKPETKQRTLVKTTLTLVIFLLSAFAIYFGLQTALATTRPFIAVATGSMSPALEIGDLLIVQGVPPENIQEDDIIVFMPPPQYGSAYNIHRVTRIQQLGNGTILFKTKGDANDNEDPYWVSDFSVQGRPIWRVPYIGYLILDPTALIIIATIILVVAVLWPEKNRRRQRRRKPLSG